MSAIDSKIQSNPTAESAEIRKPFVIPKEWMADRHKLILLLARPEPIPEEETKAILQRIEELDSMGNSYPRRK